MALLSPDPKDITAISNAAKSVIEDAIGETQRVLVQPLADAITDAINGAAAQFTPAAQEFRAGLHDFPELAGDAAAKVLDQVDGLTLTISATFTISRKPIS